MTDIRNPDFRAIVAAVNVEDDLAEAVVRTAASLARRYDAALFMVAAWPGVLDPAPAYAADMAPSAATISHAAIEEDKKARAATEKRLKEMAARLAPGAQVMLFDGDPAHVIPDIARKTDADVIVAGSHQRGFWGALWAGAASRDLVHEAPCNVFLVTKKSAESIMAKSGA